MVLQFKRVSKNVTQRTARACCVDTTAVPADAFKLRSSTKEKNPSFTQIKTDKIVTFCLLIVTDSDRKMDVRKIKAYYLFSSLSSFLGLRNSFRGRITFLENSWLFPSFGHSVTVLPQRTNGIAIVCLRFVGSKSAINAMLLLRWDEIVCVELRTRIDPLSIPQKIRQNVERRWNGSDKRKPKESGKPVNLFHYSYQ